MFSSDIFSQHCLVFAETNLSSTHRAAAVHRVLLSESAKAGLAEHVAAWVDLEGLVEQVETDGADQVITEVGQLGLSLQQLLETTRYDLTL